jgi:hypothetical protein
MGSNIELSRYFPQLKTRSSIYSNNVSSFSETERLPYYLAHSITYLQFKDNDATDTAICRTIMCLPILHNLPISIATNSVNEYIQNAAIFLVWLTWTSVLLLMKWLSQLMRQCFIVLVYRLSDKLSTVLALQLGLENVVRTLEYPETSDHLQEPTKSSPDVSRTKEQLRIETRISRQMSNWRY